MEAAKNRFSQLPLLNCIHKIVVYETKSRLYVVGSNHTENVFRVLKIDRTEAKELVIVDDQVEYNPKEIRDLLHMIDIGNRTAKSQIKDGLGLTRTASAFGLVGFVRFLEGYYLILITKRRKIAQVGTHTFYKIEDTTMKYIPNATAVHSDEQKYVRMFQNVDLSSNFYFSYSYDLTRTFQYHMTPCEGLEKYVDTIPSKKHVIIEQEKLLNNIPVMRPTEYPHPNISTPAETENIVDKIPLPNGTKSNTNSSDPSQSDAILNEEVEVSDIFDDVRLDPASKAFATEAPNTPEQAQTKGHTIPNADKDTILGILTEPEWKYVWNKHLLKDAYRCINSDWILYITHGFISQSNIQVFGKSIFLTLIARRSHCFAGTRFLKRGANLAGEVANEVETEQIVNDASVSDMRKARVTSFVQLRGSLPFMWSQDLSKMVPKPSIEMDLADPYGFIAGQHANRMLARYGAPLIVLNLVKKRERKRHESLLTEEILQQLGYLNQFLSRQHRVRYIGFDMARGSKKARNSKKKDSNVLERLATIAEYCVKKTGFFHSGPDLYCNTIRPHPKAEGLQGLRLPPRPGVRGGAGWKQRGVVRTNCVDCLDRTNTAQFALGKCALGFQLYVLGVLPAPQLDFDTDCARMLEELYEDQGDTLALQYGGSQLVHRIKGYRNVAHWTSSSKDIMQTLSRYYSNAFSDTEKQQAINVFLGVFTPRAGQKNIWELSTDFYLHNPVAMGLPFIRDKDYSQWWDSAVFESLPHAAEEHLKGQQGRLVLLKTTWNDERVNQYWDFYQPYTLSYFGEHYNFHMPQSIKDFMPKFALSCSPFVLRVEPGRREEEYGLEHLVRQCG